MTSQTLQPNLVDSLIASRLPTWLGSASEDQLSKLRTSLLQQQRIQHRLAAVFSRITPLDGFAQALLDKALSERQLPALDVRQVMLRRTTLLPGASVVPGGAGTSVSEVSEVTLLAAALHNFADQEASPAGTLQTHVIVDAQGAAQALDPQTYIALCRSVDVGGGYQRHLESVLLVPGGEGKQVAALLEEAARANLEADVRLAALKGEIDQRTYLQLLPVISTVPVVDSDTARLLPFDLRVLGKPLHGVVAFEVRRKGPASAALEGVVLWVPGDSHGALQRYATWDVLWRHLGERCKAQGYAAFLQRFISERDRCAFSRGLRHSLQGRAGALPIPLDGRSQAIAAPLFQHLRKGRLDTVLDDARVLATPTAEVNQAERERRQSGYASAGLDLLGLASLFVPVLGLPLLGIAALQIAGEVYEGYADWQLGDREGALKHLWGVAENLAAGVALASIGLAAGRLIERCAYVDALVPVLTQRDEVRLIDVDLPGYAVPDQGLAVGERASVAGQVHIRTHLGTYQVVEDPQEAGWRIRHPNRPSAYSPWLDDNGQGGWRHQLETPQHWRGATQLMQRLNSAWADLDQQTAERVMRIAGFDEERLRRLHLEHAPAPARLHDALQRYQLHVQHPQLQGEAFEQHFNALQLAPAPAEQRLQYDFPKLTSRVARELVQRAEPGVIDGMLSSQRVPLELANEARWLLHDSRLDRACGGFYQAVAVNADTQRLALGLVADMAPWPPTVRIELREERLSGALLAHSGADNATQIRYVIRRGIGYQAADASGVELTAANHTGSLFQALWLHLDPAQKRRFGDAVSNAEQLAHALAGRASGQRQRAAELLGMVVEQGAVRLPVRLGDGRLGYPLSGGQPLRVPSGLVLGTDDQRARRSIAAGLQQLFPHRPAQDVMWLALQLAQRPGRSVWAAFSELARQVERLDRCLRSWRGSPTAATYRARHRTGQAIREAWLPEYFGPGASADLIVRNEHVASLPRLPQCIHFGHLHRLCLSNLGLLTLDSAFLERFPNVTSLQLSGNKLVQLPGLGGLRRLVSLDSSANRLTLLDGLEQLTSLTQLILNDNHLSTLPGLASLTRLRRLDLQRNQLQALEGVERLTLLTQLDVSGNLLSTLPERVDRLVQLQSLNLSENRLSAVPAALGELTGLRSLNLRGNQLSAVPVGLERLRQLVELNLADNRMVIDVPGGQRLEAFSALGTLNLSGNPIGAVPPLRNLDHLVYLSLRGTGLRELPLLFLEQHPDLFVDLAGNLIAELSQRGLIWIRQHPNRLNLNNNPLDDEVLVRWRAARSQFDTLSQRG